MLYLIFVLPVYQRLSNIYDEYTKTVRPTLSGLPTSVHICLNKLQTNLCSKSLLRNFLFCMVG